MKKVAFTINKREYQLMVEDEQTEQLQQLAAEVDGRTEIISKQNPQADDLTLLMMTCLTIADELYEARQEAGALHEKFMLAQPEMQSLFSSTNIAENEKKIGDLLDNLSDTIDKVINPVYD